MMRLILKRGFCVLFFIFFACCLGSVGQADTFFGEVATGLVELADFRYPVFLFVPKNYKPEQAYPLIIAVPGEGESAEDHVKNWVGFARRKSTMILVPDTSHMSKEDVPFKIDEWLLALKKDITGRYHVAQDRIYLVGNDSGAQYAAYLGVQYPGEFSAVALLGGSWVGPFEKLIRPKSRPAKQVPFFIALEEDAADLIQKTESRAYRFTRRGYPVYLEKTKSKEEFSSLEFRKRLFDWLEEKAAGWREVVRQSEKSLGGKILKGVEEYVEAD